MAQLRARGLKTPAEPVVEVIVERISTGNPLPAARLMGESLAQMGKAFHGRYRIFRPGR